MYNVYICVPCALYVYVRVCVVYAKLMSQLLYIEVSPVYNYLRVHVSVSLVSLHRAVCMVVDIHLYGMTVGSLE